MSRLKALIKSLDQKQDLILQYLKPKNPTADHTQSVTSYDVTKATTIVAATTASGDKKSATTGGEYKLKSSGSKKSSSSSSSSEGDDDSDTDT